MFIVTNILTKLSFYGTITIAAVKPVDIVVIENCISISDSNN